MSVAALAIIKQAFQGAKWAIEFAETFVPPGELLTVLQDVDLGLQEALGLLGEALAEEIPALKAALAKNKAVVGGGVECDSEGDAVKDA